MPMDPIQARLNVLRLAANYHPEEGPEKVLATAKDWGAFVVGEPVKSSKSFGAKGADDPKT